MVLKTADIASGMDPASYASVTTTAAFVGKPDASNENIPDSDSRKSTESSFSRSKSNSSINSSSSSNSSSYSDDGSGGVGDTDMGANIVTKPAMLRDFQRSIDTVKAYQQRTTIGKKLHSSVNTNSAEAIIMQQWKLHEVPVSKSKPEETKSKVKSVAQTIEDNMSLWSRKKWLPPKQPNVQTSLDLIKANYGHTTGPVDASTASKQDLVKSLMAQWAEKKSLWMKGQALKSEKRKSSKLVPKASTDEGEINTGCEGHVSCTNSATNKVEEHPKSSSETWTTSEDRESTGPKGYVTPCDISATTNEAKKDSAFVDDLFFQRKMLPKEKPDQSIPVALPQSNTVLKEVATSPTNINSNGFNVTNREDYKDEVVKKQMCTQKNPPGKPKQPLTAYNLFFQHERKVLLGPEFMKKMEDEAKKNGNGDNSVRPKRRPHRKTHGKIGFVEMSRAISSKWKLLDAPTRRKFQEQARALKVGHEKEMAAWRSETQRQKQQEKQEPQVEQQLNQEKGEQDIVQEKDIKTREQEVPGESTNLAKKTVVQGSELKDEQQDYPILTEKPKRPLTAYNLYFQHERRVILGPDVIQSMELEGKNNSKNRRLHRKTHGKIDFVKMVREISAKWKQLDGSTRQRFEEQADADKMRYKRELEIWTRQEAAQRQKQQQVKLEEQRLRQHGNGMSLNHQMQKEQQQSRKHEHKQDHFPSTHASDNNVNNNNITDCGKNTSDSNLDLAEVEHANKRRKSMLHDEDRAEKNFTLMGKGGQHMLQPQSEQHSLQQQAAATSYKSIPASATSPAASASGAAAPTDSGSPSAVSTASTPAEEDGPLTSSANKSAAAAAAAAAAYETFKSSGDKGAAAAAGAAAYKKIHSDALPGVAAAAGAAAASAVINNNAQVKQAQEHELSSLQMLNIKPWMAVGLMNQERLFLNAPSHNVSSFIRNKNNPFPCSATTTTARLNELEHPDLHYLYMASKLNSVTAANFASAPFISIPPAASALASIENNNRRQLDAALDSKAYESALVTRHIDAKNREAQIIRQAQHQLNAQNREAEIMRQTQHYFWKK